MEFGRYGADIMTQFVIPWVHPFHAMTMAPFCWWIFY